MENPIKIDDLGVPLFSETSIYIYRYVRYKMLRQVEQIVPMSMWFHHHKLAFENGPSYSGDTKW